MFEINNLFKKTQHFTFFVVFLGHQNRSKVVTFWSKLIDLVGYSRGSQGRIMISSETQLCFNFLENMIKSNHTLVLINFVVFFDFLPIFVFFKNSVPTKQLKVTQNIVWFIIFVVISVFSACLSITKYCVLQFCFVFFMFIVNFAPTKQTKFRTLLWLSQSFLTCMRLPPVYRSHKLSVFFFINFSILFCPKISDIQAKLKYC